MMMCQYIRMHGGKLIITRPVWLKVRAQIFAEYTYIVCVSQQKYVIVNANRLHYSVSVRRIGMHASILTYAFGRKCSCLREHSAYKYTRIHTSAYVNSITRSTRMCMSKSRSFSCYRVHVNSGRLVVDGWLVTQLNVETWLMHFCYCIA